MRTILIALAPEPTKAWNGMAPIRSMTKKPRK